MTARMQYSQVLALSILSVLAPSTTNASVLWTGDFETGKTSQWTFFFLEKQLSVVTTPTRKGKYALEARAINDGDRVEVQHGKASTPVDSDRYYAWSVMTPKALGPNDHQTGYFESKDSYNQIMAFVINGTDVMLDTRLPTSQRRWTGRGKFTIGKWHDFVFHVRWSRDPKVGLVELWFDGEKVLGPLPLQTLWDHNAAFFQIGLLSGDAGDVVYIDEARETTTLQEALGADAPMNTGGTAGSSGMMMSGGRGGAGGAGGSSAGAGGETGGSGDSSSNTGGNDGEDDTAGSDDDDSSSEDEGDRVKGSSGCSWGGNGRVASLPLFLLVIGLWLMRKRQR